MAVARFLYSSETWAFSKRDVQRISKRLFSLGSVKERGYEMRFKCRHMLFADNHGIPTNFESSLQIAVHSLSQISEYFGLQVFMIKVMVFHGAYHKRQKIFGECSVLEQVSNSEYLRCNVLTLHLSLIHI